MHGDLWHIQINVFAVINPSQKKNINEFVEDPTFANSCGVGI